ncbi:MAG: glycerol dehydratase reactivase beta/small subunit family protein [Clostridia bacterium]|nr:glycerol dehydratase reactivase beta/small subunit family protein [Clostridia bacterium]
MITEYKAEKPCIKVYISQCIRDAQGIMDVCWGIEEEGIPYDKAVMPRSSALELSYRASKDSNLGVGIGIDSARVVLHYNKLRSEEPLCSINLNKNELILRSIGANAARLVKRVPFKSIDDEKEEGHKIITIEEKDIRELVAEIIGRIGPG